jgi:hypothetical protein
MQRHRLFFLTSSQGSILIDRRQVFYLAVRPADVKLASCATIPYTAIDLIMFWKSHTSLRPVRLIPTLFVERRANR